MKDMIGIILFRINMIIIGKFYCFYKKLIVKKCKFMKGFGKNFIASCS